MEYYEHNVDNLAIVASSCHLSVDLLCPKMRDVCKGSSESLGSPSFTVFRVSGRKEDVF